MDEGHLRWKAYGNRRVPPDQRKRFDQGASREAPQWCKSMGRRLPEALQRQSGERVVRGAAFSPGNRVRRVYITKEMIVKYGKTSDCPARLGIPGLAHSEPCRSRIERLMIEHGDAFRLP